MAIYILKAKASSRSTGASAPAAAAYRSGEAIHDTGQNRTFDYSNRDHVLHTEIMTPEGSPEWMKNRETLWNEVEAKETRKDAQLFREVTVALPRELNQEQNKELVQGYVKKEFVDRGMVADIAIHQTKNDNPHAHIMLTMRRTNEQGFEDKKERSWNNKAMLNHWRKEWASHVNEKLESSGHKERIDHRSYQEQGINKQPQVHLGVNVQALEDKGERTKMGDHNRFVKARQKAQEGFKGLSATGESPRTRYALSGSMMKSQDKAERLKSIKQANSMKVEKDQHLNEPKERTNREQGQER